MMSGFDRNDLHGEWFITDKSNTEIGIISFDKKTLRAVGASHEERMTKYQYNLFKALLENKGHLLSSEELYDAYKGHPNAHSQDSFVDYKKNLTDAVYNMKKKFPFLKECIENGKGYGTYFFNGDIYRNENEAVPAAVSGGTPADEGISAQKAPEATAADHSVPFSAKAAEESVSEYGDEALPGVSKTAEKKKPGRLWKIIALAAAAFSLLLLGVIAFCYFGNNSGAGETARIAYEHDSMVREAMFGKYTRSEIESGLTAYADGDALISLLAEKEYGNNNYSRSFFYEGDKLIYAEYAGEDNHRFYFEDGKMIRWQNSETLSDSIKTVNHDRENTDAYSQWEQWVLRDSAELQKLWEFTMLTGSSIKDFMIPDSNSRYISEADLVGLSRKEVRTALNELYARHGRRFYSPSWQEYFDSKSWYTAQVDLDDFSESIFNDYELENRKTLMKWEADHGWR